MPRSVVVSLPPHRADSLVGELRGFDGTITLQRQPGSSVHPPGDVVTVAVTDRSMPALMKLLEGYGAGADESVSVSMSEPTGMISASSPDAIATDVSSSSLEEMEFALQREATMDLNKLVVMAVSGAVAAVGLATNAVHLVVGAMLVAPGFEPLLRIAFGVSARTAAWKRGLADTARGYGAMVAAAAGTALVLPAVGVPLPHGTDGYLPPGVLLDYWSGIPLSATFVAVVAGVAGAILVAANRAVLTAGVMVALALVPGAVLTGMGIVDGEPASAARAALRFGHDAAIVVAVSGLVFAGKATRRGRFGKRPRPRRDPSRSSA